MSYGMQLELKYGSAKHNRIKEMVCNRRKASLRKMRNFHQKWDDADDAYKAYQPTSEVDADRKAKRKILGKHDYTTIVVPYTFAIITTAHTYWTSVFLSRAPIYQLQGRHGETQDSVEAFEAVLDYQRTVGEHLVPLYNWIFDMAKYEIGVLGNYWEKKVSRISRIVEEPISIMGIPISNKTRKTIQTAEVLKYEGNCLYNVRPHDWFPDPRVAISSFQKGEFCGRDTQVGWHEILAGKAQGRYFNIEELANKINSGVYDREYGSQRVELPDQVGELEIEKVPGPGFVQLHEQEVRLSPSAFNLSSQSYPELWSFTVANGDVVIGAQPCGAYHDSFAFDVMEFGFGAHEFMKTGLVEIMTPLVDAISWLFNSHMYNVRKSLNDTRVVDPSRVVMKDLTSPIERGIIRLKPEAYGTPVNQAIHQLITQDVTQNHIRDIAIVEQILQRVSGVVDELMGIPGGGSRESATGVRTRTGYAANRLRTVAEYNSALGMAPLMSKLISNTQQYMSQEQKLRIAGADGLRHAARFVNVNKDMIAGSYDYVPVDGTLPIDRLAQANFWKELAVQLAQSPQLSMQWNLSEMVAHIMRLQGEKNIDRFRIVPNSPEAIQQQAAAGNLVPIEGGRGGRGNVSRGSSGGTL